MIKLVCLEPGEVRYLCSHCLLLPLPFNKKGGLKKGHIWKCELNKVKILLETGKPTLYMSVIKRNEVQWLLKLPSENGLKVKRGLLGTDKRVRPDQTRPPRAVLPVDLFISILFQTS